MCVTELPRPGHPASRRRRGQVHLTGGTQQGPPSRRRTAPGDAMERPRRSRRTSSLFAFASSGRASGRGRRGRRGPLLDGDGGAGALEGGLGLVSGVLGDLLQDRLRRVVDQVLGLLEAERGQAAHLLDDLDLLVAGSLEDDVELVLLDGGLSGAATATTGGGGSDGHGG